MSSFIGSPRSRMYSTPPGANGRPSPARSVADLRSVGRSERMRCNELEDELQDLQRRYDTESKQWIEEKRDLDQKLERARSRNSRVTCLEAQLKSASDKAEHYKESYESEASVNRVRADRIRELEDKLYETAAELEQHKETGTELQQELNRRQQQLRDQRDETHSARDRSHELETHLQAADRQIADLNEKINDLVEERVAGAEAMRQNFQEQIEQKEEQFVDEYNKRCELESALQKSQNNAIELQNKLEVLSGEVKTLTAETLGKDQLLNQRTEELNAAEHYKESYESEASVSRVQADRIRELEDKLSQTSAELEQHKETGAELQQDLGRNQQQLKEQRDETQSAKDRSHELEMHLQTAQREVADLNEKINDLAEEHIASAEAMRRTFQEQIQQKEAEFVEECTKKCELESALQKSQNDAIELQNKLEVLSGEVKTLTAEMLDKDQLLNQRTQELNAAKESYESEASVNRVCADRIRELEDKLSQTAAELEQHKGTEAELQQELNRNQQQLKEQQDETQSAKDRSHELEIKLQAAEGQIADLNGKMNVLAEEQIASAEAMIQTFQEQIEQKEEEFLQESTKKCELESALQNSQHDAIELQNKLESLSGQLETLCAEMLGKDQLLNERTQELNAAKESYESEASVNRVRADRIRELEDKLSQTAAELEQHKETGAELQQDLGRNQQQLEEQRDETQSAKDRSHELEMHLQAAEGQIADLNGKINVLAEEQIASAEAMQLTFQEQIQQKEEEFLQESTKKGEFESSLQKSRNDALERQNKLESLEGELKTLTSETLAKDQLLNERTQELNAAKEVANEQEQQIAALEQKYEQQSDALAAKDSQLGESEKLLHEGRNHSAQLLDECESLQQKILSLTNERDEKNKELLESAEELYFVKEESSKQLQECQNEARLAEEKYKDEYLQYTQGMDALLSGEVEAVKAAAFNEAFAQKVSYLEKSVEEKEHAADERENEASEAIDRTQAFITSTNREVAEQTRQTREIQKNCEQWKQNREAALLEKIARLSKEVEGTTKENEELKKKVASLEQQNDALAQWQHHDKPSRQVSFKSNCPTDIDRLSVYSTTSRHTISSLTAGTERQFDVAGDDEAEVLEESNVLGSERTASHPFTERAIPPVPEPQTPIPLVDDSGVFKIPGVPSAVRSSNSLFGNSSVADEGSDEDWGARRSELKQRNRMSKARNLDSSYMPEIQAMPNVFADVENTPQNNKKKKGRRSNSVGGVLDGNNKENKPSSAKKNVFQRLKSTVDTVVHGPTSDRLKHKNKMRTESTRAILQRSNR